MRRLLLAIDAEKLDQKSLEFGCYLAQLTGSPLCGVFLDHVRPPESSAGVKFAYGGVYVETIDTVKNIQPVQQIAEANIGQFKNTCDARMVPYEICHEQYGPADGMINETRFADIPVVEPACFSSSPLEKPSSFVKDVLARSGCPVIISPYDFDEVSEIVLAYDGQDSSIFAIKQFTYLFPGLLSKKITVLQAHEQAYHWEKNHEKLCHYLENHYQDVVFDELSGKAEVALFDRLLHKKNAFVVMGAYGRSKLSYFLRHSTAELLVEVNGLPIFIAHH